MISALVRCRTALAFLAEELGISCDIRHVTLAEFHAAEEVFTTDSIEGLTPVSMIDGRVIGNGKVGEVTKRLQDAYETLPERSDWATEIPAFAES